MMDKLDGLLIQLKVERKAFKKESTQPYKEEEFRHNGAEYAALEKIQKEEKYAVVGAAQLMSPIVIRKLK